MEPNEPVFITAFVSDVHAKLPATMTIDLDTSLAIVLIGQLQLALRHPANRGFSADQARAFVDRLIERLGVTDVLRAGLLAGDNPRFDVMKERNPATASPSPN